jgi:hypothetical protein
MRHRVVEILTEEKSTWPWRWRLEICSLKLRRAYSPQKLSQAKIRYPIASEGACLGDTRLPVFWAPELYEQIPFVLRCPVQGDL